MSPFAGQAPAAENRVPAQLRPGAEPGGDTVVPGDGQPHRCHDFRCVPAYYTAALRPERAVTAWQLVGAFFADALLQLHLEGRVVSRYAAAELCEQVQMLVEIGDAQWIAEIAEVVPQVLMLLECHHHGT